MHRRISETAVSQIAEVLGDGGFTAQETTHVRRTGNGWETKPDGVLTEASEFAPVSRYSPYGPSRHSQSASHIGEGRKRRPDG